MYSVPKSSGTRLLLRLFTALAVLLPWSLGAQSAMDEATYTIAVLDLRSTGGLMDSDVEAINSYLRSKISELPNYRVIEQSRIRELMEVNELQQLSGLFDAGDTPEQLRLTGASQVILGSVGRLLDRTVVSVRLVELQTGEIAFSYTAHSDDDELFLRLDEIVERIRSYGLLISQTITVDEIGSLVDRRRYAEAQERLEAYLRQQRRREVPVADGTRFAQIREEIRANLYDDYLRTARRARRRDDFVEARRFITRAIALQPASEALEERDRIQLEEEEYRLEIERQERLLRLRAEEAARQEVSGVYLSPLDSFRAFMTSISGTPHRLSYLGAARLQSSLAVPRRFQYFGLAYDRAFRFGESPPERRLVDLQPVGRFGITLSYEEQPAGNQLVIHPTLSPQTGFVVHVLNMLVSAGIDGGLQVSWGGEAGSSWEFSPSIGTWAVADVIVLRGLGVHAGIRMDYLYDLSGADTGASSGDGSSPFVVRLFTGVTL